jgi:hypothetical protein
MRILSMILLHGILPSLAQYWKDGIGFLITIHLIFQSQIPLTRRDEMCERDLVVPLQLVTTTFLPLHPVLSQKSSNIHLIY